MGWWWGWWVRVVVHWNFIFIHNKSSICVWTLCFDLSLSNMNNTVREMNTCQIANEKEILSWMSRKLFLASGILYRTYKAYLFLGECSRSLVSHTATEWSFYIQSIYIYIYIILAVHPTCVQDSIFKMSGTSPVDVYIYIYIYIKIFIFLRPSAKTCIFCW